MTPNSNAIEQLNTLTPAHSRLQQKQGVLVIDTREDSEFDINAFIGEMREERIQEQIRQASHFDADRQTTKP
jgi:predicted sulfurtransferase